MSAADPAQRCTNQDFRENPLPQLDQWVTLPVRYDRNAPVRAPPLARKGSRLCQRSPAALPLATPGLADGQGCTQRRAGGLKRGDAGLGAGRHFAATGTAMPGIFTLTAPRWLRLVM